jgi:hypothetical protein
VGTLTSWKTLGHSRPVKRLLCLYLGIHTAYFYRVAMKGSKRMGETKFSGWKISRTETLT